MNTPKSISIPQETALQSIQDDFNRGIVRICDGTSPEEYRRSLNDNPTANTTWDEIQSRLFANRKKLLRQAVTLSKLTGQPDGSGIILVGIDDQKRLYIRQQSPEIVLATRKPHPNDTISNGLLRPYTDDADYNSTPFKLIHRPRAVRTTSPETYMYNGVTLPIPNANDGIAPIPQTQQLTKTDYRLASPQEILRTAQEAGYHVPTTEAMIHAFDAVTTSTHYLMGELQANAPKWQTARRTAVLKLATIEHPLTREIDFNGKKVNIVDEHYISNNPTDNYGAILWIVS